MPPKSVRLSGAKRRGRMLQIIIIAAAVIADQLTKYFLVPALQGLSQPLVLIPNVLNLTYVPNTGASFGMFPGAQVFFIIVTIIVLAVGVVLMVKTRHRQSIYLKICLSLVIGGALGNFIDRVALGYVRDIFDLRLIYFPWIFNVADSCLVIGAILLAIYVIFFYRKKDKGAVGIDENKGGQQE